MDNKRLKNAYLANALVGLEVSKGSVLGPLLKDSVVHVRDIDTQYLSLKIIDFLSERLASGQGASLDEIVEHTFVYVKMMCPLLDKEMCSEVAAKVLDHLANGSNNYKPFSFSLFDFESKGMKRYSFRLVEYCQPNTGEEYVYRATSEAVTLFVSMFSIDPILEHAAQNYLIKHLLETGHIAGAVEVAKRASSTSRAIQGTLQNRILELKRNPRKFGWVDDVLPHFAAARTHIHERMDEESSLLKTISDMLEASADPQFQQADLVDLKNIVEKCSVEHLNLLGQMAEAIQIAEEFHAYAFRTPSLSSCVSPEGDIIPHVMNMSLAELMELETRVGCHYLGPRIPKALDLFEIFTTVEDACARELVESETREPEVVQTTSEQCASFDEEREGRLHEYVLTLLQQSSTTDLMGILDQMDERANEFERDDYVAVLHVIRSIFRGEQKGNIEAQLTPDVLRHRYALGINLKLTLSNNPK